MIRDDRTVYDVAVLDREVHLQTAVDPRAKGLPTLPAGAPMVQNESISTPSKETMIAGNVPDHTAVYAGSFDPVTNGHLDVIERAAPLFGALVVAVGVNRRKPAVFGIQDRLEMLWDVTSHLPNVRVETFEGLLVDYARSLGARVIVRGLRAVADFEYETQQVLMNKRLGPEVETVFLVTSAQYSFLSSSLVKEVATLGGSVEGLVPPQVEARLKNLVG